jgi:hypothetical protein
MTINDIIYFIEERRHSSDWCITNKRPPTTQREEAFTGLAIVKASYGYKHEYRLGAYRRIGAVKDWQEHKRSVRE